MAWVFRITDAFNITGRGTVIEGLLLNGRVKPEADIGKTVRIYHPDHVEFEDVVLGFEHYLTSLWHTSPSHFGILLKSTQKDQIVRGSVVYIPGDK